MVDLAPSGSERLAQLVAEAFADPELTRRAAARARHGRGRPRPAHRLLLRRLPRGHREGRAARRAGRGGRRLRATSVSVGERVEVGADDRTSPCSARSTPKAGEVARHRRAPARRRLADARLRRRASTSSPQPLADVSAPRWRRPPARASPRCAPTATAPRRWTRWARGAARLLQSSTPGGSPPSSPSAATRAPRSPRARCARCRSACRRRSSRRSRSGDVRPFVGDSDIAMFFSVGDLLGGPNPVTAPELDRHRGGDRRDGRAEHDRGAPATGRRPDRLRQHPSRRRPHHRRPARGRPRGRPVPRLGVVRLGDGAPDRRRRDRRGRRAHHARAARRAVSRGTPTRRSDPAASRRPAATALPQVVLPGGLEYFCFGPPESIPAELRDRATHHHNAFNTNVRTSGDELRRVGALMAERLNASAGPVAVRDPAARLVGGRRPEGRLHDLAANQALVDALRADLRPSIEVREIDADINDPVVADAALELILRHAGAGAEQREELLRHGHNDAERAHPRSPRRCAPRCCSGRVTSARSSGRCPSPAGARCSSSVDVRHLRHRPEDLRRPLPAHAAVRRVHARARVDRHRRRARRERRRAGGRRPRRHRGPPRLRALRQLRRPASTRPASTTATPTRATARRA